MKTLARLSSIVAAAAALVAATSAPASASDARAVIWHNGERRAVGTYDDLTDTFCVRLDTPYRASVAIHAAGEPILRGHQIDLFWSGDHFVCSGNLSIPEDRRWILELAWQSSGGHNEHRQVEFYT